MNEQQTQELINTVVDSYEETESFKRTAEALHISTAKVRKALLTAGVWMNETAEEIQRVREEHESWSDQKIADHLHISLNAVQMYTPYKLGPYDPDNRGASATRMAEYRDRNRAGADVVDGNRRKVGTMIAEKAKVSWFPLALSWLFEEVWRIIRTASATASSGPSSRTASLRASRCGTLALRVPRSAPSSWSIGIRSSLWASEIMIR